MYENKSQINELIKRCIQQLQDIEQAYAGEKIPKDMLKVRDQLVAFVVQLRKYANQEGVRP